MTGQATLYLDSSAIVKLVIDEQGTLELRDYLRSRPLRVTSRIADVEVRRAIGRVPELDAEAVVRAVLERIALVELDEHLAAAAARLAPSSLRTLDAIHLSSALTIVEELEAFVTYDQRLAMAARAAGMAVASPGVSPHATKPAIRHAASPIPDG